MLNLLCEICNALPYLILRNNCEQVLDIQEDLGSDEARAKGTHSSSPPKPTQASEIEKSHCDKKEEKRPKVTTESI